MIVINIYIMFSEKNFIHYLFYYSTFSTIVSCIILLLFLHEEDVGMYVIIFGFGFGFFPWWTLFYILLRAYKLLPDDYASDEEKQPLVVEVSKVGSGTPGHEHHTPIHSDDEGHNEIVIS